MRRRRWIRGGRAAAVLAVLALALTGCSANQWERNLRFGWPTGATRQGTEMRVLWTWAGVTALILGIIVWALIFWCCVRYRKRKGMAGDEIPRQTKYNFTIEMVCVIIPFLVIAGLFYRTVVVEDNVNHLSKNPDVNVQVDAFKWNWQFEYHTYKSQPDVYTSASGAQMKNPNDRKQPFYLSTVGNSELIPILVVPVGQTVQVDEHSEDVIHSFWVPEFLFKRDVFPYASNTTTRDNKFEFTATKTGSYVGRCAELCGTYHSQMNFEVRVVPQQTFARYLAALKQIGPTDPDRQPKALKAAMPGHSPYATTTYPLDTSRTARKAAERVK
ncbi:cytochrome c oxidase subunit II [uncultured Jatrophihabitans sp.]|uniref:aa3-type cytochrome oxidase subunit II n=1 Tax=uncultured Jatrophihabitans sp. TaxID=1610747 RepID=UPI0035CAF827